MEELEHCDRFTVEEFAEDCLVGYFIDYDGSGYYGDLATEFKDCPAIPSEIRAGIVNKNFTHVYWYNR